MLATVKVSTVEYTYAVILLPVVKSKPFNVRASFLYVHSNMSGYKFWLPRSCLDNIHIQNFSVLISFSDFLLFSQINHWRYILFNSGIKTWQQLMNAFDKSQSKVCPNRPEIHQSVCKIS